MNMRQPGEVMMENRPPLPPSLRTETPTPPNSNPGSGRNSPMSGKNSPFRGSPAVERKVKRFKFLFNILFVYSPLSIPFFTVLLFEISCQVIVHIYRYHSTKNEVSFITFSLLWWIIAIIKEIFWNWILSIEFERVHVSRTGNVKMVFKQHFIPLTLSIPPEIIRKPEVYWYFQGV